jgi:hypothetical protein
MKKTYLILGVFYLTMLVSCSITSYESARTLGKGNVRVGGGVEGQFIKTDSYSFDNSYPFALGFYVGGSYGKTDYLDFSLYSNVFVNEGGVKWQFLGSKTSKFAAAVGMNIGLISILPYMRTPVYFSYHPSEKLCWFMNASMNYGGFQAADYGLENAPRTFSLSSGFQFGTRKKFAIGLTYLSSTYNKTGYYPYLGYEYVKPRGWNLGFNYFLYK